ncbi:MAG: hypothetical protein K8R44_01945 [Sulfurimonas sp.]|nr:hypothetical protein [Sulfurimonas sp.]
MTSLFNEKTVTKLLQNELATQLSQSQIQGLQYKIFTSQITDYDGIKTLAKDIKTYLSSCNQILQHGKILNILAKSYGFSNHHSMSAEFKIQEPSYETNTQLSKVFKAREEIFKYFEDNDLEFSVMNFIHKGFKFDVVYESNLTRIEPFSIAYENYIKSEKEFKSKKYKIKINMNKLLKNNNIKPYKNTFSLFKIKNLDNMLRIQNLIIQKYHTFFKPVWIEKDSASQCRFSWQFISYNNITSVENSDLFIVDSYSTDLPWNTLENFANYLFRFGDISDFIFLNNIINETNTIEMKKNSFLTELQIRKYNKFEFQNEFIYEYKKSSKKNLVEILEELHKVVKVPLKINQIIDGNAEEVKDIIDYSQSINDLSKLINKCCVDFYNSDNRYFKIQEELYYQIYFCETQDYVIELMNTPDKKENILVSYLAQIVENTILNIKEACEKNNLKPKTI